MSKEMTIKETTSVAKTAQVEASGMLEVIARIVSDPHTDIEKIDRLLQMHERITKAQKEAAFMAAKARLAKRLPAIPRNGMSHHGAYSRLEDIDPLIRPLYSEEGFALSFDIDAAPGGSTMLRVIAELSHCDGHKETRHVDLPIDNSGSKNGTQAIGSTISYGRRMLTKMHFNLVEAGEDDDGNGGNDPISKDQLHDLETMIQDAKADKARFLEYMQVERLEDIQRKHYKKAITALDAKKKGRK